MADLREPYVLAGFDGPPPSVRALQWAAKEARLRGLPLLVCHAWSPPYPSPPPGSPYLRGIREAARLVGEKGLLIAREAAPHTLVRATLQAGPAAAVLANHSSGASLAVVGAHEPTGFTRRAASSPAMRLPAYGHCPVIVVRKTAEPYGPIVVGVDGSAASEAALGFAYEEAALHERPVHIVYAYGEPDAPPMPVVAGAPAVSGAPRAGAAGRAAASNTLERLTSPWREKYPSVGFEEWLVAESPQDALCRAAEGAGLLVVGGRRLGDVGGFQLGSVSGAMVRSAPCSLAVIRPRL